MSHAADCHLPPNITLFRVVELSSRFVKLSWSHQYLFKSAFKFHYELDWASLNGNDGSFPAKLILNHRAKNALLSDLHPRTSYASKLLIRNDCGHTGLPLFLNFTTKPTNRLSPTLSSHMPHEIFIIILLLLIWLLILRHFIKKYQKLSFVSPNTAYIHGRRYSDQKTNKTSDIDSFGRRGSEMSKASVVNKFDMLEDVVCKWRSETVLENRAPIHHRDVASIMDRTDVSSTLSAEHGRKFSMSRAKRRTSNATDDVRILNAPDIEMRPKLSTNSVRPSQSYPLFRKIGSASILNNPGHPTIQFEDYDSMPSVPPCSPNKFPCETEEVSEDELERCRLLAKLSGPRMSSSEMLQMDGSMRRKVSEILLGKATVDIRRCSSISAYIRRPRAHKSALVRRQSLFQSFRKSFRRKRPAKSQGCSMNRLNSANSFSNKWFKNFRSSIKERPTTSQFDTPPYQKCSRVTERPERNVRLQISTESYFTAADVLIQIEPEQ